MDGLVSAEPILEIILTSLPLQWEFLKVPTEPSVAFNKFLNPKS